MTKFSPLTLVFSLLLLAGLVGCSSPGDESKTESITVFAAADTNNMVKAEQAELLAGDPVNFASNTLTIVTAPGNPKDATGTKLNPVSEESSVTDVLNKVTSGQADSGIVYITDALAAGDEVAGVNFVESSVAVNTYPIAVLKDAPKPDLAKKFVDSVTGEHGQKVLSEAGFAKP